MCNKLGLGRIPNKENSFNQDQINLAPLLAEQVSLIVQLFQVQTLSLGPPFDQWLSTVIASYLTELVTSVANVPGRASLRSAGRHDLVVPRSRLVSSERAFSVAAPKAWNSLPVDIRLITDTKLFKKKLKTYLFNLAYPGISQ